MGYSLDEIKKDLFDISESDFVSKYYFKTGNWYLEEYLGKPPHELHVISDDIKTAIGEHLNVTINNVIIIGSSKIGYSLSPTAKLYEEFRIEGEHPSDIDIAIISDDIFSELWTAFRKVYSITFKAQYSMYAKDIFRGFVNTKTFAEIDDIRKNWNKRVDKLNEILTSEFGFDHDVNFRIYRNINDLLEYQIRGIKEIKFNKGIN